MYSLRCEACDAMLNEIDMKDSLCPSCKRAVTECIDMDDEDMAFMSADISLEDFEEIVEEPL